MRYDKPGEKFKAWCEGKTGYPFVDAAMRQLINEGMDA
jgi:deoxyribodipyrimidine photo-lyase